ncbi:hypothetical protein QNO07_18875 [Streptomyces sp. 549]|uniref:hypothetical protein n=1 Tax=Streptomyces sp. 549 TaxID=3049076 RepID=UPI0024C2D0DD|nr:hypothetical protein [Streptomyces sp. 549]MDK1475457.1 hypothetical protein [Streptomyces sp. 549]
MTAAPPDDPYLQLNGPGAVWCYTGVRLEPDPAAAHNATAVGLPEEQRRVEVVQRERAWLAGQWAADGRCWELRVTNGPGADAAPGGGRLSCVLLGRAFGTDPHRARASAERLREGLAALPRHVRTDPLSSREIDSALRPIPDGAAHLVEVRKRLTWQSIHRSDAAFPVGVTVDPFSTEAMSWEPVWSPLARTPGTTVLVVRLEPAPWHHQHTDAVRRLLGEYQSLARPGRFNPAIGRQEPAVPFAAHAAAFYEWLLGSAASEPAYRVRIVLASDRPVPHGLPELVASTVTGPPPPGERPRPGAFVGRVSAPADVRQAWRAFTTMHDVWLPDVHQQGVPPALGALERVLADRVVVPETSSAFRLPYEVPGRGMLFRMSADTGRPAPAPSPPPPGPSGVPFPEPPDFTTAPHHHRGIT